MCGIFGVVNVDVQKHLGDIVYSGNWVKNRGPDRTKIIYQDHFLLMFHRLSIMDTSPMMDQPFVYEDQNSNNREFYYVLCNGEIYNYKELQSLYLNDFPHSHNDVNIIFNLFKRFDFDFTRLNNELNGEYALTIFKMEEDNKTQQSTITKMWISTDPSSVRPLFLVIENLDQKETRSPRDRISLSEVKVGFSSLLKGLSSLPYGMFDKKKIVRVDGGDMYQIDFKKGVVNMSTYKVDKVFDWGMISYAKSEYSLGEDLDEVIVNTLNRCVKRRLDTDRPLGCLLSGGLDSNLVAAIASRELKERGERLRTFSIGMTGGTDLVYARKVADYIGSDHTEIIFTEEEGLSVIEDVIKTCESYDITTIRASVGQYLIARWISKNTDIKVVLNGDGADEAQMGYIYYYMAPNANEAHRDSMRLIDEIHLYDGLRVDRNVSRWGLEARVPYLDKEFIQLYKGIDPGLKVPVLEDSSVMGYSRIEKNLIRSAYSHLEMLPPEVLWRAKETFSDALSKKEKSWYLTIQEWVDKNVSVILDSKGERKRYEHCNPVSKESQWYREVFEREFGEEVVGVIPHYWLSSWSGSTEPAARSLSVYNHIQK